MRSDRATSFRSALLAAVIALTAFAACAQAQTYNLRVIHRFSGAPNDGYNSPGGVQFDSAGNLYGSTRAGGTYNDGVIFKIAKDGTETILYSFTGGADGDGPERVTVDPATGDLYGISYFDGEYCGQIFKLSAAGVFSVLHVFDCPSSGYGPNSPLLRDRQGNLYGTIEYGGKGTKGTIFEYGADGNFTVLHTFNGSDGYQPMGGVIRDQAGNLYGVTSFGPGTDGGGSVYKLAPDGTFTTLYTFTNGTDHSSPTTLVGDRSGNLYGTTLFDSVFKLAPDGTFTTLHNFTATEGYPDSNNPVLPIGGDLYGTTEGNDSVYRLAADGTFTVLHSFTVRDGVSPVGNLALKYGRLFGTTYFSFPNGSGGGTVFMLSEVRQ